MDINQIKDKILGLKDRKVRFIILFGSMSRKEETPLSDIDIAVYYEGSREDRFAFRLKTLGNMPDKVDLQIFQDLPLAVQNEVIKGKPLYYDDFQFIFDKYHEVVRAFADFEKYYREYIDSLAAVKV